ncbi:MAG: hypothetical protein ACXW1M_06015 [Acidimicrobiia bacterium]
MTRAAGLVELDVQTHRIGCPELSTEDLVRWRLGMAHTASFFDGLTLAAQRRVVADAITQLADAPPLVRSMVVIRGSRRR